MEIKPIEFQPIAIFRSVAHSNGNEARRITLPVNWVRAYAYPHKVSIVVGNLIIIADEENKELAERAAQLLCENNLMYPLEEPEMEKVG